MDRFVVGFVNKNGGRFSVVTYKYANEGINEIDQSEPSHVTETGSRRNP